MSSDPCSVDNRVEESLDCLLHIHARNPNGLLKKHNFALGVSSSARCNDIFSTQSLHERRQVASVS